MSFGFIFPHVCNNAFSQNTRYYRQVSGNLYQVSVVWQLSLCYLFCTVRKHKRFFPSCVLHQLKGAASSGFICMGVEQYDA